MELPPGYQRVDDPSGTAVVRADLADLPIDRWWGDGVPLEGAAGRGAVAVLELGGVVGVARDYRRGGVLRALKTRFLDRLRGERELAALVALRARGVPALEPLAAVCRRRGVFYHLRLITLRVAGARPLPAFLACEPDLARAALRESGRVVAAAFDAGLDHPDLHPDNLLVSRSATGPCVHVMDLDRAVVKARVSDADRDRMLLRMARYLERHAASLPVRVRAVDLLRFLAGMGWDRRRRAAEWSRLAGAYERAVARHRVAWKATR